jgi:hypothetical protein
MNTRLQRRVPAEPLTELIRGRQTIAMYLQQEVPEFEGNPLLEALPPLLTKDEVVNGLTYFPPYSDNDRQRSIPARLHMLENAREFFVPHGKHLEVHYAISNMLRRGYIRRNPVLRGYWIEQQESIKRFAETVMNPTFHNSKARGFAMVGVGGTGKSTTVEKILQMYPQVITHVKYKEQDCILKQLVWLKLDCPRNGSLKGLCKHFFVATDEILGTEYAKYYGGNRRDLEDLLIGMVRVASNHCLGLLVIDEIQDLSEAKGGGSCNMLNFFVHLENRIGVPFTLIGTPDAIPLLSGQFRQARRVSEQGDIVWDRMNEINQEEGDFEEDDEEEDFNGGRALTTQVQPIKAKEPEVDPVWRDFVQTLWIYQYVQNVLPLKENLLKDKRIRALYSASKGIPAVAQTVFLLAQRRAITTGIEKITSGIIKSVAHDSQNLIREMLDEARMHKPRSIHSVSDLFDWNASARLTQATDIDLNEKEERLDTEAASGSETRAEPKIVVRAAQNSGAGHSITNKSVEEGKLKVPKDRKNSKNDLRNSTSTSSGKRKNKYSKSVAEYIS